MSCRGEMEEEKERTTSLLRMKENENGVLSIRHRSSFMENEAGELKRLMDYLLCFSSAKSTLKVLLAFNNLLKTKVENFFGSSYFFFFFFTLSFSASIHVACEY